MTAPWSQADLNTNEDISKKQILTYLHESASNQVTLPETVPGEEEGGKLTINSFYKNGICWGN